MTAPPGLKSPAAIALEGLIVGEKSLVNLFFLAAVLAAFRAVIPADTGTLLINITLPIRCQMPAGIVHQQEPSPLILKKLDVLVRKLPQKDVKVINGARSINLLGYIAAANRGCTFFTFIFAVPSAHFFYPITIIIIFNVNLIAFQAMGVKFTPLRCLVACSSLAAAI